jgi:hypothetical protein
MRNLTRTQQSFTIFDVRASALSIAFLNEAEKCWRISRLSETPLDLSARSYLSLAATMFGREDLRAPLIDEIFNLGTRLKLFGVPLTTELILEFRGHPDQWIRQVAHVAWGTYAWLT